MHVQTSVAQIDILRVTRIYRLKLFFLFVHGFILVPCMFHANK